jgi:ABC-2 type transport system permease protein
MRNIWLIARREYLERIRTKSFIVMTVLLPAIMAAVAFGGSLLGGGKGKPAAHIIVVTQDVQLGMSLQSELEAQKQAAITADLISPPGSDTRDRLNREVTSRDLDGYLWITPSSSNPSRNTAQWVTKSKPRGIRKGTTIDDTIRLVVRPHIEAGDIEGPLQTVDLDSSPTGNADAQTSARNTAYAVFFLMYFVILFYGMNVARSIIEEKTSRIFEVLLATIRPEELMAGKVIGVGSVGLTQVGIWIAAGAILGSSGLMAAGDSIHLTLSQGIYFIVFFLLGYILYSSIAAALGAMTSSEQELQQMNIFLMLPLIACSTVIYRVVTEPTGFISKAFSFFPFCTPLIMYVRIAVGGASGLEIAISIVELILTIWLILWIASRIYRVGILMYGKRPNLPEIIRWLKYS